MEYAEELRLEITGVTVVAAGSGDGETRGIDPAVGLMIAVLANTRALFAMVRVLKKWVEEGADRRVTVRPADGRPGPHVEISDGSTGEQLLLDHYDP